MAGAFAQIQRMQEFFFCGTELTMIHKHHSQRSARGGMQGQILRTLRSQYKIGAVLKALRGWRKTLQATIDQQ